MKNIKQISWDKCSSPGITGNPKNHISLNPDQNVDVAMEVSSKYQGRSVLLKILEKISDNEYIAVITGFEPPAETYEDLSINDYVYIDRKHICWLKL